LFVDLVTADRSSWNGRSTD